MIFLKKTNPFVILISFFLISACSSKDFINAEITPLNQKILDLEAKQQELIENAEEGIRVVELESLVLDQENLIKELKEKIEDDTKVKGLESRVSSLETKQEDAGEDFEENIKFEGLESRVSSLETRQEELKEKPEDTTRIEGLESQVLSLGTQVEEFGKNLKDDTKVKGLESRVSSLETRQEELKEKPEDTTRIEGLESQVLSLETQVEEFGKSLEDDTKVKDLETQVSSLETQVEEFGKKIEDDAKVEGLESRVSSLETRQEELKEKPEDTTRIEGLESQVLSLETQVEEFGKNLDDDTKIKDLETQVSSLETQIKEFKENLDDDTKIKDLESQVLGFGTQVEEFGKKVDDDTRIKGLEAQILSLEERQKEINELYAKLLQDTNDLKAKEESIQTHTATLDTKNTSSSFKTLTTTKPPLTTIPFDEDKQIIHLPELQYHKIEPSKKIPLFELGQFQLLHTLLDYKKTGKEFVVFFGGRILFDFESEWADINSEDSQSILIAHEGKHVQLKDVIIQAREVFLKEGSLNIPDKYEDLNLKQKDFLFKQGAVNLLYYLQEIDKVYKVMTELEYNEYVSNRDNPDPNHPKCGTMRCWDYDYVESKIKEHVVYFLEAYKRNHKKDYEGKIFIIHRLEHDLDVEFSDYSFDRGEQVLAIGDPYKFISKN